MKIRDNLMNNELGDFDDDWPYLTSTEYSSNPTTQMVVVRKLGPGYGYKNDGYYSRAVRAF